MLSKKKQKKYLLKREKDWFTQLQLFGQSDDQEAIHQLRLGVKKVKAFVQLVKSCSDKRAGKDFNLLKNMFRQAGKIRDANNNLQLLEKVPSVSEFYRQEQDRLRASASAEFRQQIDEYRKLGKKAGRRLLTDVHAIPARCIKDWYASRVILIGVLLTESGDKLHEARKAIKEILYVQNLLPKQLIEEMRLNTDYLDALQDVIGQWHDAAMVAATFAGHDGSASEEIVRQCREKENEVRELASEYYRRVHEM